MITRIEIDGFKTFRSFKLDLNPLQIIIGPNAAGKSNLFDALILLSHLADTDLRTAFQRMRGNAGELFTIRIDGARETKMKLAAEMLVEPKIVDSWGAEAELKYTRLRYELVVVRQTDNKGLERLYVEQESLISVQRGIDKWAKRQGLDAQYYWLPRVTGGRAPFISTETEQGVATVFLHQDGRGGRKGNVASRMERTVLSGVSNTEFSHAFAARTEMRSWRFLQLNPEVLRQPSSMVGSQIIGADGSNLPGVLARLQAHEPYLLADIGRDLGNLVPGVVGVEVESDRTRDEYVIWVVTQDGRRFSSRVLSDGTLRMLALVVLKNDPEHRGVILFEEPENGVHPHRLKNIARLIGELATNFSNLDEGELPLRQFLCNTHSPVFAGESSILPHVLFAFTSLRSDPDNQRGSLRITRIVPVRAATLQPAFDYSISQEEASYTLEEVRAYLESADLGEARGLLDEYAVSPLGQNGSLA